MSNLQTLTRERKRCPVKGVFWHKPSKQFLCYVGYHFRKEKPLDAWLPKVDRRVRSTHYVGSDEQTAVAEFLALKGKWKKVKGDHQKKLAEMKAAGLPLPKDPRPVWPTARETVAAEPAVVQPPPVIESRFNAWSTGKPIKAVPKPAVEQNDPMDLTVEQGLKKFLEQYKARVGLRGGKGIKANTYAKHSQNMICGPRRVPRHRTQVAESWVIGTLVRALPKPHLAKVVASDSGGDLSGS